MKRQGIAGFAMFLMFFLVLTAQWLAPTHRVQAMGASDQYTSRHGYIPIVPAQRYPALSGQSFGSGYGKPMSILIREMREPAVHRANDRPKYDPEKLLRALSAPVKRAEPDKTTN